MKTGEYSVTIPSVVGGNAVLLGLIAAGALVSTPPSGSLGALTSAAMKAAETSADVIGILDFGRNDLTLMRHSQDNFDDISASLGGMAGAFNAYHFEPSVTNKTTAGFSFKRANGNNLLYTLAAPAFAAAGAFEEFLRDILSPAEGALSGAGLINQIENALAGAGREGFLVINGEDKSFWLWATDDTSPVVTWQTEAAAVAATIAAAFIGKYHMEPTPTPAGTATII